MMGIGKGIGKEHLLVNTTQRILDVVNANGSANRTFPIAIGAEETPTPRGNFKVLEKIDDPAATMDFSEKWENTNPEMFGPRSIDLNICVFDFEHDCWRRYAIHGTDKPELMGEAVSLGCIRLKNDDILELYDMVEVGMPVIIV